MIDDTNQTKEKPPSTEPVDILIAEDDPFIGRMYLIKLQGAGYSVVVVNSGRSAIEEVPVALPKLVLLDINMPELNGFEVYDVLKHNNYDFSRTKVIFLTNSNKKEDIERAKKLNCDYIIKSDSTPKQVLELIESKLKNSD